MTVSTPSPTLDDLFRRTLARQPHALALIDPKDKVRICGQAPKSLTYAQADRAVSALAAHFVDARLPANSVIALQLPNTVEFVLTLLAAYRAGLVVALLPQLWRQSQLTVALNRTGARAIVSTSRIDGVSHADVAMNAAAEAFSIRHVCGFGRELPEGMASLDDVIENGALPSSPAAQDGRRTALISFDVTPSGFVAVPRTHLGLMAGGLAVSLESGIPQGATVLSTIAPGSFAGTVSSLVLWLLSGGTLALHHPFDGEILERQILDHACDTLVAPAALAVRLAEAGVLQRLTSLRRVVGLWRSPEQIESSPAWSVETPALTDVYLFGESGLLGAVRGTDGMPAPIFPGTYGVPRSAVGTPISGEILITSQGTLALRGAMVSPAAYASAEGRSGSLSASGALDMVDTGYAVRIDRSTGAICITAPPPGVMAVGGYRFLADELQEWTTRLGQGALLTALPDGLFGHRLAGRAQDNGRAREALIELGLNPLMSDAFRNQPSG